MLSLPETWDYTLKGLAIINREGVDAIREAVRELEKAGYIVRTRVRNAKGRLTGTEYVIYEQPQAPQIDESEQPVSDQPTSEKPVLENPILDNPALENPARENPVLGKPALENPTQLNTHRENTHPEKTYPFIPNGGNPYPSNPYPSMRMLREAVEAQIGYDAMSEEYGKDRLDEIVSLMVEILCTTSPTLLISGEEYPIELVHERFQQINSLHIQYMFECLHNNASAIRNIKAYMDLIRGCIETRADDILKDQREAALKQPVYKFPASYAKEHGETAEYRESFKANIACKAAIEDAIARYYHDNRLDAACTEEVVSRFGMERTAYVIAATLQDREWDGRISPENKAWAKGIRIPSDQDAWGGNRTREYVVSRPHPGLLNLFATLVRKEQAKERDSPENRPSVSAMLQKPAKKEAHTPAAKKPHEPER